jgi:ribosomal protection tetracycline resistance protein
VEADVGQMPISFYRAIEETVLETLKAGVFGWQVIDCQVVLTEVRHSSPSSTAADFRGLTPLVLAEALSHAEIVVCEPVEHFQLEIPSTTLPGMVTLLAKCGASISETLIENSTARLDGMIASIHVQNIRRQLPGLTSGVGIMESTFDHHARLSDPPPRRSHTSANPFNRVEFLAMTRR